MCSDAPKPITNAPSSCHDGGEGCAEGRGGSGQGLRGTAYGGTEDLNTQHRTRRAPERVTQLAALLKPDKTSSLKTHNCCIPDC